jgi:hypothetical protein
MQSLSRISLTEKSSDGKGRKKPLNERMCDGILPSIPPSIVSILWSLLPSVYKTNTRPKRSTAIAHGNMSTNWLCCETCFLFSIYTNHYRRSQSIRFWNGTNPFYSTKQRLTQNFEIRTTKYFYYWNHTSTVTNVTHRSAHQQHLEP